MADGAAKTSATEGQLATVVSFANKMVEQQLEVDRLTALLKEATDALNLTANTHLPEAMNLAGLTQFKTTSGFQVDIKDVVSAGIPKSRLEEALAWLRAQHAEGIIKTVLKVQFGKGEDERAAKLAAGLKAKGYTFDRDEGVHGQTLTAWVKERDRAQLPVNDELLGVYRAKQAKLKQLTTKDKD